MVDHYFDLNDYKAPIKTYFADKYRYYGNSASATGAIFYLQENEAILNDNYLTLNGNEEVKKYISIAEHQRFSYQNSENHVFKMTLSISEWYLSNQRNVYTLLDCLGDLGGIYEIFITLGYVFVTLFSSTAFYYSILPKLYQVDTLKCQQDNIFEQNRRIFAYSPQQRSNQNKSQKEESKYSNSVTDYQFEGNRENEKYNALINKAHKSMQNRRSYNYSCSDALYNVW